MLFLTSPSQTPYIKLLAKKIGFDDMEYAIATNNAELEQRIGSLKKETPICIDVALDWNNNGLAMHYGFSVGADLRRVHSLRNPVIFCGFPGTDYYQRLAQSDQKFHILFGNGSYYMQYPFTAHELVAVMEAAKPIDRATLHDVVTMLCNLKGIVNDKLNHRLIFEHGQATVQNVLNEVAPFISSQQKASIGFDSFSEKLIAAITNNNREDFNTTKDLFLRACTLHLTQDASVEDEARKAHYKILLLDDRQLEVEKYASRLEKDFTVIRVTESKEAISILEKDTSNSIVAVISDWRLYKDDTSTFWQEQQGYEVLKQAARTDSRAMFALTSQADYVVHQIRNLMGIKFSMFKKENIETPDQWQLFRSIIMANCAEVTELMASIPSKANWVKPQGKGKLSYRQEYLQKRNSVEWEKFENDISAACNKIWYNYYWKFLNKQEQEALQNFSVRFGRELNTLENMLIARRICIALFFKQSLLYQSFNGAEKPRINTYSIFRNKLYVDELDKNRLKYGTEIINDKKKYSIEGGTVELMDGAATQLLNTELCLDTSDLVAGKGMLPEEKNWLRANNIEFTLEGDFDKDDEFDSELDDQEEEEAAAEEFKHEPTKTGLKKQIKETQALREQQSFSEGAEDDNSDQE